MVSAHSSSHTTLRLNFIYFILLAPLTNAWVV